MNENRTDNEPAKMLYKNRHSFFYPSFVTDAEVKFGATTAFDLFVSYHHRIGASNTYPHSNKKKTWPHYYPVAFLLCLRQQPVFSRTIIVQKRFLPFFAAPRTVASTTNLHMNTASTFDLIEYLLSTKTKLKRHSINLSLPLLKRPSGFVHRRI